MTKIVKWIGIVLGSVVGVILLAGIVMYFMGNARLNKTYEVESSNLTIPTDAASIELGRHRAEALCAGCHGTDLSGVTDWFNAPPLGIIDSANLTSGEGGIGDDFTDEDFVRAIRHGVNREDRPIFMVAVVSTSQLSDQDLAAIIAYLRTIPAVDHVTREKQFTPLAKILLTAGVLPALPAEVVSHDVHVSAPPTSATAQYGKYLIDTHDCRLCHGPELNGGPFPDPTITKISPNLTPGGELAFWTEEQFINTIRTGMTPGGHQLDPKLMPWDYYGKFHDEELQAIWLYLQSLPNLSQYTG
jgi:cytochrome c553